MNEQHKKSISKFLSLILRHSPQTVQIQLDENGWANVDELITKCAKQKHIFTFKELEEVVATNDKKRFIFNEDKTKIRANQGHSIAIDLALQPQTPPDYLYHGTVSKFLNDIKKDGLLKMSRQHVHLSAEKETAIKVGSRRGLPVILIVQSSKMHQDGYSFYLSENGVWLTDHIPSNYIEFKN